MAETKITVHSDSTEDEKRFHPKTFFTGMAIILGVLFVFTYFLLIKPSEQNKETPPTSESTTWQEESINRQRVIDTYAPQFCSSHQAKITTFQDENMPSNDGSGWTDEECVRIISLLYDDYKQTEQQVSAVANSKVIIGMSSTALWYSWGNPNKVNTSNYGSGNEEQVVYDSSYVYIKDGKVTSYQIY